MSLFFRDMSKCWDEYKLINGSWVSSYLSEWIVWYCILNSDFVETFVWTQLEFFFSLYLFVFGCQWMFSFEEKLVEWWYYQVFRLWPFNAHIVIYAVFFFFFFLLCNVALPASFSLTELSGKRRHLHLMLHLCLSSQYRRALKGIDSPVCNVSLLCLSYCQKTRIIMLCEKALNGTPCTDCFQANNIINSKLHTATAVRLREQMSCRGTPVKFTLKQGVPDFIGCSGSTGHH